MIADFLLRTYSRKENHPYKSVSMEGYRALWRLPVGIWLVHIFVQMFTYCINTVLNE